MTARTTLCVIRYDHLAMKLGPDVQEWKFNHGLWTSISDARICKRCSVNQTSFQIPTVYSHFLLIFPRFLACCVWCGAFIQCGGNSATDVRAVRYWARANWIRPEPDLVLRSAWSLKLIHACQSYSLPKLALILDTVYVRYFNTPLTLQKAIDEVYLPWNSGLQTDMSQGCEIYTKVEMINIRHTQCTAAKICHTDTCNFA